jgi:hypothetical protein
MSAKIDLTGGKFGRLTVIKDSGERDINANVIWTCQCDCGNVVNISAKKLKTGDAKSCGCLYNEKRRPNLAGQRFGRLVVVNKTKLTENGKVCWTCKCDCGKTTIVKTNKLISGRTLSCGCLLHEYIKESRLKLSGERFGFLTVIKESDMRTNDMGMKWECKCDCGNIAIVAGDSLVQGLTRSCGCLKDDTFKLMSESNLQKNCKEGTYLPLLCAGLRKDNKTGVKGVYYEQRTKKYRAAIAISGKQYKLGRYANIEDATKARKQAEYKYFNPVLEKYGREIIQ